mgnify:CR=1 FL=1
MVLRLLMLPFRLVGFLVSLVFTVGILEGFGLYAYLQWRHEATLEALLANGVTVPEVLDVLFGHLDVLGVAAILFVAAFWLALTSDSSGSTHADGWDDGDGGGGFGGFGGDGGGGVFGGDGGGGGGDGGGGGGGE